MSNLPDSSDPVSKRPAAPWFGDMGENVQQLLQISRQPSSSEIAAGLAHSGDRAHRRRDVLALHLLPVGQPKFR
jgi:hypothetical protein